MSGLRTSIYVSLHPQRKHRQVINYCQNGLMEKVRELVLDIVAEDCIEHHEKLSAIVSDTKHDILE